MNSPKILKVLDNLKKGIPIVVVDDYDRENEGDLVLSAQAITKDSLVFAMNHAGGLMCLPCDGKILDELNIPLMVKKTNDPLETPFTVSIDHAYCSTGMSAEDRLKTISLLTADVRHPELVRMPGHLFPLRARDGRLVERRGHTEASVELMKMAGLKEVAIIIEIMNSDGTMAKGQDLVDFCTNHGLELISIQEIYEAAYDQQPSDKSL